MRIYGMDKILTDIYNIRNIEFIKVWDLQSNIQDKTLIIPGLMIMYDNGKVLNLCSKDKYFDIFVKKVVQVYHDEKNNILEDSLTDPFHLKRNIDIDDKTKKILDSGILEQINNIYSFYDKKDSYDSSLLFQIDEVKNLLPIINYHLEKLFSLSDQVLLTTNEISGYHDVYNLSVKVDGIDKFLPLSFSQVDDNKYEIEIGGLNKQSIPITMQISFDSFGINVDTDIPDRNINTSASYVVTNGVVKEIYKVTRDDLVIHYENKDLDLATSKYDNIVSLDSDNNFVWYQLPWNAIYGIDTKITDISEVEKNIEINNMYLSVDKDNFMRKEYYTKYYMRDKTVSTTSEKVILDEVIKNMNGIRLNHTYLVETNFVGEGRNGYYDNYLKNRYFYHLSNDKSISDINRDNLVPVSKKDDIVTKADTLNKIKILKIVGGK